MGNKQWKEKLPIIAQCGDKHRSLRRRRLLSSCSLPCSPSSHTQTHTHTHTYTRLLHPPCSPPPRSSCAAVLSIVPSASVSRWPRLCSPLVPPPGVSEPLLPPRAPLQPALLPEGVTWLASSGSSCCSRHEAQTCPPGLRPPLRPPPALSTHSFAFLWGSCQPPPSTAFAQPPGPHCTIPPTPPGAAWKSPGGDRAFMSTGLRALDWMLR